MHLIARKTMILTLGVAILEFVVPAYAGGLGLRVHGDPNRMPDAFARSNEERAEVPRPRRQEREVLREELRQRQREGLSPAVGFDSEYEPRNPRRMSAEERRQLRRELNDAARDLYGERR